MLDSSKLLGRLELEIRRGGLELVRFELGDWDLVGVFFEADGSTHFKYLLSLDRPLIVLLWVWFEVLSWLVAMGFDKVLAVLDYQESEWKRRWWYLKEGRCCNS
jgi:hypothetical protein